MTAFRPLPVLYILLIGITFLFPPFAVMAADGSGPGNGVLVVLSSAGEIHRNVLHGIAAVLQTQALEPHLDIHTQEPGPTHETALRRKLSRHPSLIVTIGTRATQAVFEAQTDGPVLSVLVPERTFLQLATENGRLNTASAVYLDQPPDRQIALARILLPGAQSAGLLFGPGPAGRKTQLLAAAERQGLTLNVESPDGQGGAAEAIKKLLYSSDLLLALHDPVALTPMTAKWMLYMAYQRRLPVIGFSRAYLKAGAVASVFSTPAQIGRQAGERVLQWLENGGTDLGDPQYPRYYSVEFNQPVAESLEIRTPDNGEAMQQIRVLLGERG